MKRAATKSRRNFLGFGKKTTHSPKLSREAYEAGRKSGDTKEFGKWLSRQGEDLHGTLKRRLEKQYRAGVHSLWKEEKKSQAKSALETAKELKQSAASIKADAIDALVWLGIGKAQAKKAVTLKYREGDSLDDVIRKTTKKNPVDAKVGERWDYTYRSRKNGKWRTLSATGTIKAIRRDGLVVEFTNGRTITNYSHAHDEEGLLRRANPATFDRCVSDVKKSLKKSKRPGNAYAICTASGARNARRLQGRAKTTTATKKRNYESRIWSGKQGGATAEVYKTGKSSFEIDLTGPRGESAKIPAQSFGGALSIARVKLHELASNPKSKAIDIVPGASYADTVLSAGQQVYRGVSKSAKGLLKKAKAHLGRKKNPIDQAMKMYEEFHGIPSEEILEITEQEHVHSVKVGIGLLVSLRVLLATSSKQVDINSPGFEFHNRDGGYWTYDESTPLIKRVMVTSSEDGKQLFLDGGDQAIPADALKGWGFTGRDEHDHMVIGELKELTYRTRKSFDKGEIIDYYHELGKEGSGGVLPLLLYYPRSKRLKIAGGRYYIAPPDRGLGASPGIVG